MQKNEISATESDENWQGKLEVTLDCSAKYRKQLYPCGLVVTLSSCSSLSLFCSTDRFGLSPPSLLLFSQLGSSGPSVTLLALLFPVLLSGYSEYQNCSRLALLQGLIGLEVFRPWLMFDPVTGQDTNNSIAPWNIGLYPNDVPRMACNPPS